MPKVLVLLILLEMYNANEYYVAVPILIVYIVTIITIKHLYVNGGCHEQVPKILEMMGNC